MSTKFQLKRPLSVKSVKGEAKIRIGVYPPRAIEVDSPPPYLASMLAFLSSPHSADEVLDAMADQYPGCNAAEVKDVFEDLIRLDLIEVPFPEGRYHRHELYFSFFGVYPPDYEKVLSTKTVGVVGSGGIGSTSALLLTAAGVGTLVVSDGDTLEESNLTRTILFEESDIGMAKVELAKLRLQARNRYVEVIPVPERFNGPGLLRENFAKCDILLLSSDCPAEVHSWTNEVSLELGIPYINAGYIETYGVVGPLIIPGVTGCYNCNLLNGDDRSHAAAELNRSFQVPSYGPLNALVSSIAVNEVIRYFLKLENRSKGTQILIDSSNYQMKFFSLQANSCCGCQDESCKTGMAETKKFDALAENYKSLRANRSINALVLDEIVLDLIGTGAGTKILDIGCGIGTLALSLAHRGHHVTGIDVSSKMIEEFRRLLPKDIERLITIVEGDITQYCPEHKFDRILMNLILDHMKDPVPLLRQCHTFINPDGLLVAVVPHPLKDAGRWKKIMIDGKWEYEHMVIDNYFHEGLIEKSREDDAGNVVIERITTYKRTLETYFNMFMDAGFNVQRLLEPQPRISTTTQSANYSKSSKIPYFLVFCCSPR